MGYYCIDPIKLDKTSYAAGFESKRFNESESEDEKYPSRVPFESVENLPTRSPRNISKKKEKKNQKQLPVFDMNAKIKKVKTFKFICVLFTACVI